MPVRIRPATAADLPAADALERAVFTAHAISPRQMRYLQQSTSAIFLVATVGGQLAGDGIVLLRRHRGRVTSGRIYSVVVDENFRGQKIGKKLAAALIKAVQEQGGARVYLEVQQSNTGAIALYKKLGFHITKPLRHYYGRNQHGVHMMLEATE